MTGRRVLQSGNMGKTNIVPHRELRKAGMQEERRGKLKRGLTPSKVTRKETRPYSDKKKKREMVPWIAAVTAGCSFGPDNHALFWDGSAEARNDDLPVGASLLQSKSKSSISRGRGGRPGKQFRFKGREEGRPRTEPLGPRAGGEWGSKRGSIDQNGKGTDRGLAPPEIEILPAWTDDGPRAAPPQRRGT